MSAEIIRFPRQPQAVYRILRLSPSGTTVIGEGVSDIDGASILFRAGMERIARDRVRRDPPAETEPPEHAQ